MRKLILLSLLLQSIDVYAQENNDVVLSKQLEENSEHVTEATDLSASEEERTWLLHHPIDINHSNEQELTSGGIINSNEAMLIVKHRNQYGLLMGEEELQQIDGMDAQRIRQLRPYICFRPEYFDERFSLKNIIKNGHGEWLTRTSFTAEKTDDYFPGNNNETAFAGDPFRIFTRLKYTAGTYFSAGITGEKDPGERFGFSKQQYGFDFVSIHLFAKPLKFVKAIALGDYRLQFGQGLVMWQGLSFGKSADIMLAKRTAAGILPYSSAAESGFSRGVAISIGSKKIKADLWFSSVREDATLITDGADKAEKISTLYFSGYHRTQSEIDKRNNILIQHAGIHTGIYTRNFKCGYTGMIYRLSLPLSKSTEPRDYFDPEGNLFVTNGIDYTYNFRNALFYGETAIDRNGNTSTLNGLLLMTDSKFGLSFLHRRYPVSFYSPGADPFRGSTNTNNESGIYAGFQWQLKRTLKLNGYTDIIRHPWLRYLVNQPSTEKEWLLQLVSTPNRTTELYARIRLRQQDETASVPENKIPVAINNNYLNVRFNCRWSSNKSIIFQSRIEWNRSNSGQGYMILQDIQYKPMGYSWSLSSRIAFFSTDNYDNRMYAYEANVPGNASVPSYSGGGSRFYLLLRKRFGRKISCWIRYGRTITGDSSYSHMITTTDLTFQSLIQF